MATVEVSEYNTYPRMAYGAAIPVSPLPSKHTQVTTGVNPADTITLASGCKMVALIPSADVRIKFTTDGSMPTDPTVDTTAKLLKAGLEKMFMIEVPGTRLRLG